MRKLIFALVLVAGCASTTEPPKRQHTETLEGQPCTVSDPLPEPYYCQDEGNGRGIVVAGN